MAKDPEQLAHQQWLGYVQPVGLVVSIPALLAAQAHVNRNIAPEHQRFLACLGRDKHDELIPEIQDFPSLYADGVGLGAGRPVGRCPGRAGIPGLGGHAAGLQRDAPAHVGCTRARAQGPAAALAHAYPGRTPAARTSTRSAAKDERHWQASPHARFERLLRETEVPIGLLASATDLRLVYAPRGETSGYMTFPVKAMAEVAGRPMFAALHMLLEAERLFTMADKQRLPAILADSRKYQNVVSTQLAEQVLAALYELVRGFQAADDDRKGQLLADVLREDPEPRLCRPA